jgi:hypothetical protein
MGLYGRTLLLRFVPFGCLVKDDHEAKRKAEVMAVFKREQDARGVEKICNGEISA